MDAADVVVVFLLWLSGIFISSWVLVHNQEVSPATYTCTPEQADKITEICLKKAAIGHCYERQTELRCKKDD